MEVETMEVNRYCEEPCRIDEFWSWRAAARSDDAKMTSEDFSLKQNVVYSEQSSVSVRPLGDEPVNLKGDVTIIDPFKMFYGNPVLRMDNLKQQLQELQQEGHWEFLVMYKGHTAYFISSESWDQDAAFEISRNGASLGVDELPSRFIAVVTKQMVDIVMAEIGHDMKLEGGVSVQGVDGQLIRSGDGDFVISGSGVASPVRKVSRWIEDDCVRNADILCTAGGRWTYCDDSSDDEDDEELEDMDFEGNM